MLKGQLPTCIKNGAVEYSSAQNTWQTMQVKRDGTEYGWRVLSRSRMGQVEVTTVARELSAQLHCHCTP